MLFKDYPFAQEGFHAYLHRMACRNGIEGVPRFLKCMARVNGTRPSMKRASFDDVDQLIGLNGLRPASLSLLPDGNNWRLMEEHRYVAAKHVLSRWTKYCPYCLKKNGYFHYTFELIESVVCPFHGIMLIDACQQCGNAISLNRPLRTECKCGWELTAATTTTAPGFLSAASHFYLERFFPSLRDSRPRQYNSGALSHPFLRAVNMPALTKGALAHYQDCLSRLGSEVPIFDCPPPIGLLADLYMAILYRLDKVNHNWKVYSDISDRHLSSVLSSKEYEQKVEDIVRKHHQSIAHDDAI